MNTMIKTHHFPSLVNEFINLGFDKIFNDDFGTPNLLNQSPVNINETTDAYFLEMVAPGREKADFSINLDKNLLTISYLKKEEAKEEGKKTIRKEFKIDNFKRTFTLNEQVDATKIGASYVNGILHVVLPKKEEVKVAPTSITVE
jgi:HSP20 family protein